MHIIQSPWQTAFQYGQNIITDIRAEELLGYYNYSIHCEGNGRLLIIYGDNGSGKTTLLKLVYYLLSSNYEQGHKSNLAKTRFKSISVTLSNGTVISAKRPNNDKGDFNFSIENKLNKKLSISCLLKSSNDGKNFIIQRDEVEKNAAFRAVMSAINALKISLYFLQDDRDLLTASAKNKRTVVDTQFGMLIGSDSVFSTISGKDSNKTNRHKFLIEEAFSSLNEWIKIKVIAFSNVGESNNQNIYLDLVKSISFNANSNELKSESSRQLLRQLDDIAIRNQNLSNIGLVAGFDYYSLIDIVKGTKDFNKLMVINNVLTPFIEGSIAKLNALSEIYNIITLFISNVNDYFYDKSIIYHLNSGFSVIHNNGDVVQMSELSSGEKHLLHLWINSIIAEDATIFIIDEPEISLNIKWQRRLLNSLLSYTESRKIQFIIATHSIELLANNSDSVVKLVNQNSTVNND